MEYIFLAPPLLFAILFICLLVVGSIIGITTLALQKFVKLIGGHSHVVKGVET